MKPAPPSFAVLILRWPAVVRMAVLLSLCALWSCASPPQGTSNGPLPGVAAAGPADAQGNPRGGSEARLRGLDDLLALARERNPGLAALRQRAERLAAVPAREEALPDPMLMTAMGSMAETAAGRMETMTSASQAIPFPGKRRAAAESARREAEAVLRDVAAMELRIEQQVRSAWWNLWLAHESARLHGEAIEMLEALRETVDAQVAADRGRQVDQVRLGNELTLLEKELVETDRLIATVRAQLNQLLNRDQRAPLPMPPAGGPPAASVAGLDRLLARALEAHPELDAAELRRQAYDHRLERARLEAWPDFNIGLTHAAVADTGLAPMATGRDQLYATVGVNVPLWREPRRAMVREAEAGQRETESLVDAARSDLRFRVLEAHAEAVAASRVAGLFEERLVPDSGRGHELALGSYAAGEGGFGEVIETWQEQLGYRLQHATARARAAKADAALRAAANTGAAP